MKLTFLGTGSESGVPVYGCNCKACQRALVVRDYHRLPSALLVESGGMQMLINAGITDLTTRFPPGTLQYILLTSTQISHVQGLFQLRWGENTSIEVIAPKGIPDCIDLWERKGILQITTSITPFAELEIKNLRVVPVPLQQEENHFGYVVRNQKSIFAYMSKIHDIPQATLDYLDGTQLDLLVVNCVYPPQKDGMRSIDDINAAMALHQRVRPTKSILTGIGHQLDLWAIDNEETLPTNMMLAADRLTLAV